MSAVHVSTTSKQDYVTPLWFMEEVEEQFGVRFMWDIAASHENHRRPCYWTEEEDSLRQPWTLTWRQMIDPDGRETAMWLNPPYKNVTPWMAKCVTESNIGCKIVTLTLASLGTRWYEECVRPHALTVILQDRLTFEGQTAPYPKELMLCLWGFGLRGLCWWSRKELE